MTDREWLEGLTILTGIMSNELGYTPADLRRWVQSKKKKWQEEAYEVGRNDENKDWQKTWDAQKDRHKEVVRDLKTQLEVERGLFEANMGCAAQILHDRDVEIKSLKKKGGSL